mgnify:CR=1 FL=1
MFTALHLFCIVSFLGYGVGCLVTEHMVGEFSRYRLRQFRVPIGILQILGAIGLLAGLWVPAIGGLAAGGLAVLMLLGLGLRLKIRDGVLLSLPAFLYMLICAWLCAGFLDQVLR